MKDILSKYENLIRVLDENIDDPKLKEKILAELEDARRANREVEYIRGMMQDALKYSKVVFGAVKNYIKSKKKEKSE